jgi:mono/diheme cytochrome c family protein
MVMPVLKRARTVAVALVLALVALVACAEQPALPENADPELRLGQEIYRQRCQSCHGPSGGGGIGPSVRNIEERLDDEAQIAVVVNGRKSMPRFATLLDNEEIAAVVRYTREFL